jgi:hypothetical protein
MSELITRVESNVVTVTLDNEYSGPDYLEVCVLQGRDENDKDILHIQVGCEGHVKSIGHVKNTGVYAEFIPAKKETKEEEKRCQTCMYWIDTPTSKLIYNRRCSNPNNFRKILIPDSEIITHFKGWCEYWEGKQDD